MPAGGLCGQIRLTMTGFQKIIVVAIVVAVVLALIKLFRVFNSPDGERFQRLRTQGPFVPAAAPAAEPGPGKPAPPPNRKGRCSPDDRS